MVTLPNKSLMLKNCVSASMESGKIKGQVHGVDKGDVRASIELVSQLFGIAQ